MKITLLIGLLSVASAWGGVWHSMLSWSVPRSWSSWGLGWGWTWGWQSKECRCTSSRISLEEKLVLAAEDNDPNKDGLVTYDDLWNDPPGTFDYNLDGVWTERECLRHFRCRYGDTDQVAQFMCANILQGEASVVISSFNVPPFDQGVPLDSYLDGNRDRYNRFFTYGCVNREITVEEKLTLNAANNDFNRDGLVTSEDIEYDLNNLYDTDSNGAVTKAEFVQRWVCNYGDSGDYARYVWDIFRQGQPALTSALFSVPPFDTGVPIEDFKANNRQNYENFKNLDVSNYIRSNP